jgi:hypothetical protein
VAKILSAQTCSQRPYLRIFSNLTWRGCESNVCLIGIECKWKFVGVYALNLNVRLTYKFVMNKVVIQ